MQRESPTDATVTVHPSTITNVAVVPEVSPADKYKRVKIWFVYTTKVFETVVKRNYMPLLWNSLSVLTNPATIARGKA